MSKQQALMMLGELVKQGTPVFLTHEGTKFITTGELSKPKKEVLV